VKVISFAEGANPRGGGLGLVGVPGISKSLADRGHEVVLKVAGRVIPGAEHFMRPNVNRELQPKSEPGVFSIITYPSYGRWAFAPTMFWSLRRTVANADFISLHSLYSFPIFVGYLVARIYHKPYGLWPHGVLAPFQRRVSAGKKRIYDWIIARHILNEASVLFFSATGERDEVRPLGLVPPSVIIPHGIDLTEYVQLPPRGLFRTKFLQGYQGPLVLFLSRLNAKKGLDILAQAFAIVLEQMPEVRLAIVGPGDPSHFESRVKCWLRECGINGQVIMPGLLKNLEKLQAFADSDVFVLPSEAENFSFAMFEAMASRIPVVVSDTLNYSEEIRRCESGFVVRRDPREFADAILKLLTDSALRKRMGENGLRLAQLYSWAVCGEKVDRTIQCILQGKSLPIDLTVEKCIGRK
jgi:glycosyltransferase involved in cell wall biosynthesis